MKRYPNNSLYSHSSQDRIMPPILTRPSNARDFPPTTSKIVRWRDNPRYDDVKIAGLLEENVEMAKLTHLDNDGNASMVDVGSKQVSQRRAVAKAFLRMNQEARHSIESPGANPKGEVLQVARLAGIQAAKFTSHLIPLCHQIPLDSVSIEFLWEEEQKNAEEGGDKATLICVCESRASWKTGVEMEAMTGASVAALTVYDMCKAVDREMELIHLGLWEKSGGKSGDFKR